MALPGFFARHTRRRSCRLPSRKPDGWVFYKCQKHGVTCDLWRWELEYVKFLVDKHYLSGEAAVDAIGVAEERREELLKAQGCSI
ncbi:hypothetical protein ZWY2020_021173 [Hordeum vulgare]|nr:hypothetical protein ZWY2020_021173 [Hordeum vulgare]